MFEKVMIQSVKDYVTKFVSFYIKREREREIWQIYTGRADEIVTIYDEI